MKFYLSSHKLGNEIARLKELIPAENKKTAYISNALDFSDDLERRKKSEQSDVEDLKEIGLDVEPLDLRNYFNRQEDLEKKLNEFGVIWIRGGSVFVLRQAMKLSGFDGIFKKLIEKDILYGGYSAGICILAPTLRGMDLVDNPCLRPYEKQKEVIWDGLGILDYSLIPHYKSNHPESERVDQVVEYLSKNKLPFKTLRDGEVEIIE